MQPHEVEILLIEDFFTAGAGSDVGLYWLLLNHPPQ